MLDQHILPDLGEYRLHTITPAMVRNWHATLAPKTPTYRAHAYSLLQTIKGTAVTEQLIVSNPCVAAAVAPQRQSTRAAPPRWTS